MKEPRRTRNIITMPLYLGIDVGGTKTDAIIADHTGKILGTGRAGPANWEVVSLDGTYHELTQALDQALDSAGVQRSELCAGGYGLAGLDWPADEPRLREVVARLGVPGPQVLVNDGFVALRAGSDDGAGVAIISGTGSTIAGRNRHGDQLRTFGLGMEWGDCGAASDIVDLATRAVVHAYTGRGQQTSLTNRLLRAYQVEDVPALAERVSRGQAPPPDGQLAPLVFAAAAEGDIVAREVLRSIAEELGANAAAVARRLGFGDQPFPLVLAGSVFRANAGLLPDLVLHYARESAPGAQLERLSCPPVVGGVLLALDATGIAETRAVRQRLIAEYT